MIVIINDNDDNDDNDLLFLIFTGGQIKMYLAC